MVKTCTGPLGYNEVEGGKDRVFSVGNACAAAAQGLETALPITPALQQGQLEVSLS